MAGQQGSPGPHVLPERDPHQRNLAAGFTHRPGPHQERREGPVRERDRSNPVPVQCAALALGSRWRGRHSAPRGLSACHGLHRGHSPWPRTSTTTATRSTPDAHLRSLGPVRVASRGFRLGISLGPSHRLPTSTRQRTRGVSLPHDPFTLGLPNPRRPVRWISSLPSSRGRGGTLRGRQDHPRAFRGLSHAGADAFEVVRQARDRDGLRLPCGCDSELAASQAWVRGRNPLAIAAEVVLAAHSVSV